MRSSALASLIFEYNSVSASVYDNGYSRKVSTNLIFGVAMQPYSRNGSESLQCLMSESELARKSRTDLFTEPHVAVHRRAIHCSVVAVP